MGERKIKPFMNSSFIIVVIATQVLVGWWTHRSLLGDGSEMKKEGKN